MARKRSWYSSKASGSGGFSENVVDQIQGFLRNILEWDVSVDNLVHLNSAARDCIESFRHTFDGILQNAPRLTVAVYYVTGAESKLNVKVTAKVDALEKYVRSKISQAQVDFKAWDCKALLAEVRRTPQQTFRVPTVEMFATDDERAVVCLVRVYGTCGVSWGRHREPKEEPTGVKREGLSGKRPSQQRHSRDT